MELVTQFIIDFFFSLEALIPSIEKSTKWIVRPNAIGNACRIFFRLLGVSESTFLNSDSSQGLGLLPKMKVYDI